MTPQTSSSEPAAAAQSNLNVSDMRSLPLPFVMWRPGHWNRCVRFARKSLTSPIWTIPNTAMMIRYGAYARSTVPKLSPPPSGRPTSRSTAGLAASAPAPGGRPAPAPDGGLGGPGPGGRRPRPAGRLRLPLERLGRFPYLEESDHGEHGRERSNDVRQLDRDVVRRDELHDAEREGADEDDGPGLADATQAVDDEDEDERDDQSHERRLPADHRAEVLLVEAGDLGQRDDRDRDRAECHRRRVRDERDRCRLDRLEAESDQHHRRDRDRGAEAGERLEQRPEREGDGHGLDALVR